MDFGAPRPGHLCKHQLPAGLLVLTGLCDSQARPRSEEIGTKEMIQPCWVGTGHLREQCQGTIVTVVPAKTCYVDCGYSKP